MLSRTARLAALVTSMSGALLAAQPRLAVAATPFKCGDSGFHICCTDGDGVCPEGQSFCCAYDDAQNQLGCDCAGEE